MSEQESLQNVQDYILEGGLNKRFKQIKTQQEFNELPPNEQEEYKNQLFGVNIRAVTDAIQRLIESIGNEPLNNSLMEYILFFSSTVLTLINSLSSSIIGLQLSKLDNIIVRPNSRENNIVIKSQLFKDFANKLTPRMIAILSYSNINKESLDYFKQQIGKQQGFDSSDYKQIELATIEAYSKIRKSIMNSYFKNRYTHNLDDKFKNEIGKLVNINKDDQSVTTQMGKELDLTKLFMNGVHSPAYKRHFDDDEFNQIDIEKDIKAASETICYFIRSSEFPNEKKNTSSFRKRKSPEDNGRDKNEHGNHD